MNLNLLFSQNFSDRPLLSYQLLPQTREYLSFLRFLASAL